MNYSEVNMLNSGRENCYIIKGEKGDILIDTGSEEFRDEIETWLMDYNVKLIVLTHGHIDHVGNAAYFSELYKAPIAMGKYDIGFSRRKRIRKLYAMGVRGMIMKKAIEMSGKNIPEPFMTDIFLEDGMDLGNELGIENCTAVSLEGHTRGSFGVLHGKDLYLGDAAMNFFGPSFPLICESPQMARKALDKIKELSPERIFFGHGEPIEAKGPKYRQMFMKTIF